jgi:hypothetical protein
MNPSILFQVSSSEYMIVRVTPESVAKYVTNAKTFNRLISELSGQVDHDVVSGGHKALPIDESLRMKWLAASPIGTEHSTPPAQWCFSERLALAMSLETHPLVVIPAMGLKKKDITAAVTHVLGAGAVVGPIEKHIERTALDEVLDNLDNTGSCGCTS